MSNIDTTTRNEILRKLTPAIGRVLGKRHICDNTKPNGCSMNGGLKEYFREHESWYTAHNAALEQVLDPDIVEAVIEVNERTNHTFETAGGTVIISFDKSEGIRYKFKGINPHILIPKSDIPAFIAEAWQI